MVGRLFEGKDLETVRHEIYCESALFDTYLMESKEKQYFSTPAAQAAPEFLAQGYVYNKNKYQPVPFMDLSIVTGAGSVISTVLDYTKWIKALIETSGPISKKGYKALLTSRSILEKGDAVHTPFTGPETYALGWFTGTYQGYEFFTHSGGMEAFGAEVIFFPKLKYGIVSLGNTATSNAVEERLMWYLVDEKIGVPERKRFDWNKKYKALRSPSIICSPIIQKSGQSAETARKASECLKGFLPHYTGSSYPSQSPIAELYWHLLQSRVP
jgi:hypothetical protein